MKKVLIWILVLVLVAVAAVGGTLAYLKATDAADNVMTVGEAQIEIREYQREDIEKENEAAKVEKFENDKLLIPSVVSDGFDYNTVSNSHYVDWNQADADGDMIKSGYTSPVWDHTKITNEIDKMVFVKNTGECDVYVRLCFAFEAGNYVRLDRFKEMVHLNLNTTDWEWEWVEPEKDHISVIDDTGCFLAWATYKHVLPVGEHTNISLSQIALDFSAINDHAHAFGDKYEVKVFAQGIQADGFTSDLGYTSATALETGFEGYKIPFEYEYVNFTDLKTALHYLDGDTSKTKLVGTDKEPNYMVNSVTFGLTEKYAGKVKGYDGTLVANKSGEADFTACAYYVPNGENYDIYVLADDWKIHAPATSTDLFGGMAALTKVDTSILDVSNVTKANGMFNGCKQLVELDTSSWRLQKVDNTDSMFLNCLSLATLDVSGWGITTALTDMDQMFDQCNALKTLDCSGWDVSKVATLKWVFRGCKALTKLDVSGWEVGQVGAFTNMFTNCMSLKTIPVDTWTWDKDPGSNATVDMQYMFSSCTSLTSLDLSGWDVGKVTNTNHMFSGCTSLTSVNVGGWNTEKLASMANMFENCFALTDINISNWNVGNLGETGAMFKNCFALKTLDLSGWTLREEGGINMGAMFKMEEASYKITPTLTTIYVGSGWAKEKINTNTNMFEDCTSLVGVTSKGEKSPFVDTLEGSDYAYVGEGGYLSEKK